MERLEQIQALRKGVQDSMNLPQGEQRDLEMCRHMSNAYILDLNPLLVFVSENVFQRKLQEGAV